MSPLHPPGSVRWGTGRGQGVTCPGLLGPRPLHQLPAVCSDDSFLLDSAMCQAPALCPVLRGDMEMDNTSGCPDLISGPPEADPKEGLACGASCRNADSTRGRVGGLTQGISQACYHRGRLDPTPNEETVRSAVKFTPRCRAAHGVGYVSARSHQ